MVVDSCLDSGSGQAVALRYLDALGVSVTSAIKLVVVTHWHNDHIKGISQVVEAAVDAPFVCSGKDRPEIFDAVATAENSVLSDTGLEEFSKVLAVLRSRRPASQRPESVGPIWAAEGKVLHRDADTDVVVMALSPSPATETLASVELASFLAQRNQTQTSVVRLTPNKRSIALWVAVGSNAVLLGGDLENSPDPTVGWKAVVSCQLRRPGLAHVIKVPHHGSENADEPTVWSEMLAENPHALIAPYSSGRKPRPSPEDVDRISQRTTELFCTAPLKGWKPPKRGSAVEKTARDSAQNRRVIRREAGHVRIRMPLSTFREPTVELFGPALKLTP